MDETKRSATSTAGRPRATRQPTTADEDAPQPAFGAVGTQGSAAGANSTVGRSAEEGAAPGSPRGVIDRVKDSATARLTAQKDRATEGLGTVAQAVRRSTDVLRAEQHETAARFVERAADQLQRVSTQLREKNINQIVDAAASLARRQPAIFIGLSFAAGLLTARFLRSSQERADRELALPARADGVGGRMGSVGGYSG
jgi:hypothetical protein